MGQKTRTHFYNGDIPPVQQGAQVALCLVVAGHCGCVPSFVLQGVGWQAIRLAEAPRCLFICKQVQLKAKPMQEKTKTCKHFSQQFFPITLGECHHHAMQPG